MDPAPAEINALLDAFNGGRSAEAEHRAVAMTCAHPDAGLGWLALGTLLAQQGRSGEALVPMQRAAAFFPSDAEAHNNLGTVLQCLDRFAEAETSFHRALALKPSYAEAHNNLGTALMKQARLAEAEAAFRQAALLNPAYAEAHYNLGVLLRETCRLPEAEACFRNAIVHNPNHSKAHQNLIFTLDLTTSADAATQQAERKRWAARFAPGVFGGAAFPNSPDPDRRLRIGYVSADFKSHSAATVFGAMLTAFDAGGFEVFGYSNSTTADAVTAIFKAAVTHWRPVAGLADDAVAALIREDAIDILVDLSGHSVGNRLGVFAKRPAPIQITAWGYLTGTGMQAMDVILADPLLIPEDEKRLFAERVRYLPNGICAFWATPLPDVAALPAATNRAVTFGSLNRLCKVSDEAFSVWVRVLRAVPGSRLLIKSAEMDNALIRQRVLGNFAAAGIDQERIIAMGRTRQQDHLMAFNRVDILLDSFPHGGGVTTLEGLMMGVPVVTLKWPTIVGRLSATILTAMGMADWISATPDEYVEIAVRKAANQDELGQLRRGLRARLNASVIGDTTSYVAAVEQEYTALWKQWCEGAGARV